MRRAAAVIALLLVAAVSALAVQVLLPAKSGPTDLPRLLSEHRWGDTLRYLDRRLEGHSRLQVVAAPALGWMREQVERPVPLGDLPTLGKGQQAEPLPALSVDASGWPRPLLSAKAAATAALPQALPTTGHDVGQVHKVNTMVELERAWARAQPGDTLVLAPGSYTLGATLSTPRDGAAGAAITVKAEVPGTVTLLSLVTEGIVVSHANWHFENLTVRGACKTAGHCEHAFHVVGGAQGTVLRNNLIEDFNAHVKVNGSFGRWPDHGLVEFNTLRNRQPRPTDSPVTPFDLVGASDWQVVDNVIRDFVKLGGDRTSYGAFMKGGGSHGRFERNLVICTSSDISQPGERVGLSFGNGGTAGAYCRGRRCEAEHSRGVMRANVVAHCNDSGIDIHESRGISVERNTLVNTAGLDARGDSTAAAAAYNLLDGSVRARGTAVLLEQANEVRDLSDVLRHPDAFDLRRLEGRDGLAVAALGRTEVDFCGLPVDAEAGALSRACVERLATSLSAAGRRVDPGGSQP